MKQPVPPARQVREAFGVHEEPVPLSGGRGLAWRVGDFVFKPVDLSPEVLSWQVDVLSTVDAREFRLSFPQRAIDGELVVDGWTAWTYLPGEHRERRWPDTIAVGDDFHQALAGLPRPSFIAARTDPWAIGDRVAWGEASTHPYRDVPHVARLADHLAPVEARDQLIHGDLTGNVLFADGLPPAVIDLSLYWRPAAFATAVVVADALVWEGADESLLQSVTHVDDFGQLLARALIYRLIAAVEGGFEDDEAAIDQHYRRAVDVAVHLAAPT
jgi:uncharacterized protein (TIGR02569 family)